MIQREQWGFCNNEKDLMRAIALLNSKVGSEYLKIFSPTVDFKVGDVIQIPDFAQKDEIISELTKRCIELSKEEWNSYETSWDFVRHPLIGHFSTIADAFQQWTNKCNAWFESMKNTEEELNRVLIDIYGLQDEMTPDVDDKDITIRRADLGRDIRSFISYAVGCMFGRYSLNTDGVAYAGGKWDDSGYAMFKVDKDNIIPISDDEYFEDDIVGRFMKFVEIVYGKDSLQENLKFIADALGGKGQPKDVIRTYFMNEFFKDHCNTYQVAGSGKRPDLLAV